MDIYLLFVFSVAIGVAQAVGPIGITGDSLAIGNPNIQLKSDNVGKSPKYAFGETQTTTPYPSNMTADQIRDAKLFPDHRVSRIDVSSLIDVPTTRPEQRNRPDSSPLPDPSPVSNPYPGAYSSQRTKHSQQSEPSSLSGDFRFNGNGPSRIYKSVSDQNNRLNNRQKVPLLFSAFEAFLARMGNMAPRKNRKKTSLPFNQLPNIPLQQPIFSSNYLGYPQTNERVREPPTTYNRKSYFPYSPSSGGSTYQTEVDIFPYTSGSLDHITSRATLSLTPQSQFITSRTVFNSFVPQSNLFNSFVRQSNLFNRPRVRCSNSCTNYCFFGYETDGTGCNTCVCKKPVFSMCPASSCPYLCPSGYERNSLGCDTCTCIQNSLKGGMNKFWANQAYNHGGFE